MVSKLVDDDGKIVQDPAAHPISKTCVNFWCCGIPLRSSCFFVLFKKCVFYQSLRGAAPAAVRHVKMRVGGGGGTYEALVKTHTFANTNW